MGELEHTHDTDLEGHKERHRKAFEKYHSIFSFNFLELPKYKQRSTDIQGSIKKADSIWEIDGIICNELDKLKDESSKFRRMLSELSDTNKSFCPAPPVSGSTDIRSPCKIRLVPPQPKDSEQLRQLKAKIYEFLDDYINSSIDLGCFAIPKFSFFGFGHHHNGRARAVKNSIHLANSPEEIGDILYNQKHAFEIEGDYEEELPVEKFPHLDKRWTSSQNIKNKPDVPGESEYYRKIEAAHNYFQQKYPDSDNYLDNIIALS